LATAHLYHHCGIRRGYV